MGNEDESIPSFDRVDEIRKFRGTWLDEVPTLSSEYRLAIISARWKLPAKHAITYCQARQPELGSVTECHKQIPAGK